MVEVVMTPSEPRFSEDRTLTVPLPLALRTSGRVAPVFLLSSRFRPFSWAALVMPLIWSRRAARSVCSLAPSKFSSLAAMILPLMSLRRSVIFSAPLRATATVDCPSDRLSEIALKPLTSDSITLDIAQTAELSLAEATAFPVEIIDWVLPRSALMFLRVCSATIAPLLVRMLDMVNPFRVCAFALAFRDAARMGRHGASF